MTIFARRIILKIPSFSPVLLVNILSFHIEPGFFKPHAGHTGADRLTNLRQFGQRSEFLFFDEFIKYPYRCRLLVFAYAAFLIKRSQTIMSAAGNSRTGCFYQNPSEY